MESSGLRGRCILIAEDEPIIALDIADAFESVGAITTVASTLHQALIQVEDESLCAAVIDHVLGPHESSPLCNRLQERDLPFLLYTGLGRISGSCAAGVRVAKPERPEALVSMMERLLGGEQWLP